MAFTTATINDVAKDPGGAGIPFAIVFSYPRHAFANAGTSATAHSAVANANGVFTLSGLECTDDAASTCTDTFLTDIPFSFGPPGVVATNHYGSHHVTVLDPHTGEHVFDSDVIVPISTGKPTNLATLALCTI